MKVFSITPFFLQNLVWIPTRLFLGFFMSFRIWGKKNLSKAYLMKRKNKVGVIFAVNHSSELDPILIPASLSFLSFLSPIFYVARERDFYGKKGLWKYFFGGAWFHIWGAYEARVGTGDFNIALKNHLKILNKGNSLCIFPEGGKTKDGSIREGKSGVSFLADKTKSVIIPVRITGVWNVKFKDYLKRRKKIRVSFGEPFFFKDIKVNSVEDLSKYKEATKYIMEKIKTS